MPFESKVLPPEVLRKRARLAHAQTPAVAPTPSKDAAAPLPCWAQAPEEDEVAEEMLPPESVKEETPAIKVHATADLSCRLDLDKLCHSFVNCDLGRKPSAPLLVHLRNPRSNVKVVADGRVDFVGVCSVEEARHTLKRVAKRCLQVGFAVKFKCFEVRQVSWTQAYDLHAPVNLMQLARRPGVDAYLNASRPRVRVPCASKLSNAGATDSSVEASVFASGKVWFSGARSEQELWLALSTVLPVLEACRCERLDTCGVPQRKRSVQGY